MRTDPTRVDSVAMDLPIFEALQSAGRFIISDPRRAFELVGHAFGSRIPIPLDALRWLAARLLTGKKAPQDLIITARPPALAIGATVSMMKNRLRANASIHFDEIRIGPDELGLTIRVRDLDMKALDPKSPMAQLLASGAMNLNDPAGLMQMGGQRPKAVVEAKGDRFVIDLLTIPEIRDNARVRQAISAIAPVVQVPEIRTQEDTLLVCLDTSPRGLPDALKALRG